MTRTISIIVRPINSKKGHQIGYDVYDFATQTVLAQFKNRDFGGAAFWRRAKSAAEAKFFDLTMGE